MKENDLLIQLHDLYTALVQINNLANNKESGINELHKIAQLSEHSLSQPNVIILN
jgi:hypothetical protein